VYGTGGDSVVTGICSGVISGVCSGVASDVDFGVGSGVTLCVGLGVDLGVNVGDGVFSGGGDDGVAVTSGGCEGGGVSGEGVSVAISVDPIEGSEEGVGDDTNTDDGVGVAVWSVGFGVDVVMATTTIPPTIVTIRGSQRFSNSHNNHLESPSFFICIAPIV